VDDAATAVELKASVIAKLPNLVPLAANVSVVFEMFATSLPVFCAVRRTV
jgi:hypothetical protein